MLRPSPVPSFVVNTTSSTRSISPINASNSQQQLGFTNKDRNNSFSSIQPTNNPLASVQNLQKQLPPTPTQMNNQNENKLTRNSSDAHKFFSNQNMPTSQIDTNQKQHGIYTTQIKTPPPPLNQIHMSTGNENGQPSQEHFSRFNSLNNHSSPKHHMILSEGKPISRILQNSQSTNVIHPPTIQANITKIANTPSSSSTQKPLSFHMKKESISLTPSLGSLSSVCLRDDEPQQPQIDTPSLQNQISQNTEQLNISSIPTPLSSQDSKVLVHKSRSNSNYVGNSPSIALPTFSAEQMLQSTSSITQTNQIVQQQQPVLIKNRSSSILNEGTPTSQQQQQQQLSNQFFTNTQNDRSSFNHTQPLPPTQPKLHVQQSQDKQAYLIHDLQQKILILLNENEKVNSVIRQKQQQTAQLETQVKQLKEQNDDLKQECDAQTIAVRELSQTLKASQNKEQESLKQCDKIQESLNQLHKESEEKDTFIEQIIGEKEESDKSYQQIIEQKEQKYKQLLTEMEEKINMLVEENNQLNEIVQSKIMKESSISQQPYSEEQIQQIQILIQENQKLEQIITNFESQQSQELQELKSQCKEKEENLNKFNQEYTSLLNANESIQQKVSSLEDKMKTLLEENEKLLNHTKDYDKFYQEAQRVKELKSENEILLENLKSITKEKQKIQFEIQQKEESFQQQQAHILEQCAQQTNNIEEKLLEERIQFEQKQEEFMKEKEDLLNQFDKFKEENTLLAKQISEIEEKIENLIIENQELNALTQGQRDIIESLEKKQEQYTEELKKQFDSSLRQKIEENLMQLTNRYNEEINKLHNEIIKRNEDLVEEREQSSLLQDQVNRLKGELSKVMEEIKELKEFADLEEEQKYEMQKHYQQQLEFENNDVKNKIEVLEQEKLQLQQQLEEVIANLKNREDLVQEYQQQILNSDFSQGNNNMQIQQLIQTQNELIEQSLKKDDENKELMQLIEHTKLEFDTTIQQYQQLVDENNQLKDQLKEQSNQGQDINTQQQSFQKEFEELKKERDELLQIKKKQQIELSKKNKELVERKEELDHLQLKLEQSFTNHHNFGSYTQIPQIMNNSNNQQVLSTSQSQKLNNSNSQFSNSHQQKSNYRN